jgi:signal transduction histidine kinase/CheY-like chemotaxis protein
LDDRTPMTAPSGLEAEEALLSLREPASQRERRTAIALMVGYAAIVLGLMPLATLHGPSIPQSVTVFTTGIIVTEFATACLLMTLTRDEPDWLILLVSCAYLFSALMGIAHLLTFPGALVPDAPLLGGIQLTSYVFNVWRVGFAVLILCAVQALETKSDITASVWRRIVKVSWCAIIAIVALGFLIGVDAENRLPIVVVAGQFTTAGLLLSWAAAVLGALALAALVIKTRGRQVLHLWLILALTTFCGDLLLSTFSGGRFTLGWYAGRASGFVSGATLFVLFLMRFAAQQRLSVAALRALSDRTVSLQLEIARRSEAEDRLVQSQKVEALGQLTGGIAHDFNNLPAVVVGNLDLVRGRPDLDGRTNQYIDNALSAADRGTKLASQLLVFSRSQRLELKALVVADVIAGMQELLTRTLGPPIKIRIELDSPRVAVLSERTQLELAVLNLAINARDAMPDGGELTISVTSLAIEKNAELEPDDYVRLSVSDTGRGMTPEIAARAFEPFFTTKGPGKGTGLGLSQVFGIAGRGGGTARIESRAGHGTTVHMFLRCIDTSVRPAESSLAGHPPEPTVPIKVLIVDDDQDVRQLLVNAISALGHSPIAAEDGARGLAAMEESKPDLILLDFAMPGMNGAEFGKIVRSRFPAMPIVFVTGYADTDMIESVVDESALILRKPFRSFELKAILGEAIRRRP